MFGALLWVYFWVASDWLEHSSVDEEGLVGVSDVQHHKFVPAAPILLKDSLFFVEVIGI